MSLTVQQSNSNTGKGKEMQILWTVALNTGMYLCSPHSACVWEARVLTAGEPAPRNKTAQGKDVLPCSGDSSKHLLSAFKNSFSLRDMEGLLSTSTLFVLAKKRHPEWLKSSAWKWHLPLYSLYTCSWCLAAHPDKKCFLWRTDKGFSIETDTVKGNSYIHFGSKHPFCI